MTRPRMHPDQVTTDAELVRRLLAAQFPDRAGLPVVPVPSWGTDHDIYRLGDRLSVRLPKIAWAQGQAEKEARWLPVLAPQLPLSVPVPVALGAPGEGYPFTWSVQTWLPGDSAASSPPADPVRAAEDLAAFVLALRAASTDGAPPRVPGARGCPLADLDAAVRRSVVQLGDRVDAVAVLASWQESLEAPVHAGPGTWLHGDLLPGNLLVEHGRLGAVLDFGTLGVGDPACDLLAAWNLFPGSGARRYREALDADDAAWLRGRGWALAQAVTALPYYWDTNPAMVRQAWRALAHVLAD